MFRIILPATLACLALPCAAETIQLMPNAATGETDCTARACDHSSRVRVLACLGDEGVWFEGRAYGWEDGTVSGRISIAVICAGTWRPRDSLGATQLTCSDGTGIDVLYTNQDNASGTGLGFGQDIKGRAIRSWTGAHVLAFLTPEGQISPRLSCGGREWMVS